MRTEAIDWLGVLATEEEIRNNNLGRSNCIVNKWDTLQFYLKVISRMPGQASNTQYVVCYSNRLDNEAIVDNGAYDEDVRIDDYVKQLKNYFFRFNYEENQAGYFVAKNIDAINLSEDYYPGKGFTTIPMIVSKHPVYPNDRVYDNFEELENALKNDEYVSKLNKYNTSGLDNIPYLIFHNTETLEYRIIGNFTGFDYDVTRGIRYDYNELKSFVFEEDWYDDVVSFENNNSLLYVGDYVHKKIMAKLDETEAIAVKEKIESNQEDINDLFFNESQDDEWEFIEHFEAVAKKDGLFYTKKDLINFHAAVKSSSLVILSGLSGTGKSQLVQCYAKALGLIDDSFHMIPVRPNWNDDSDLIGFVDSMHMVYRPSDAGFINILMEACQERNKNKLYIICFDEMNLARVEHYFSQFLSILEMPEKSRVLRLYSSEYESRLYMMYDTSVTIVIISPHMKESKWIDWEIEYCLKDETRKGRTSHNNGVVGVIMKYNGGYDWFKTTHRNADGCSSTTYEESKVYDIINNNRFNQNPKKYSCAVCKTVNSLTGSYIAYVDEETFLANPFKYINNAYDKSENDASGYDLTKTR